MTVRRHELSEAQWASLAPLLPPQKAKRGRPSRDHRTLLNGILWKIRTGAPWRDVPERYGPWQTLYGRFRRWAADGLLLRMARALQLRLDHRGVSARALRW